MKSCTGAGERAPLRTVLQNFLNHVETSEKLKDGADDRYEKEFQDLKLLSESLRGSQSARSCAQGEKEVNRRKNRYKDILPFDYTRVILGEIEGIPGSDYINANYIRGASGSHAYIASQGPLAHTVADFWRMVVECDVQVIVMACNEEESGKHKCECYWVDKEQETRNCGPYTVKLLKARRMCDDFNLRTMELTYSNSAGETVTRTVVQFHYWAWPDHGVPALVRPLLDMVRLIRDCQASETLPLLIHCSAGCGRTGTICAIDYVWGLLRAGKLTEDFSLFELIADMRRQRVAMVQTKDQYILVHRAVRELFIEQLNMIDAHPYENLDHNGHPLICPSYETVFDPTTSSTTGCSGIDGIKEVGEDEDVCHDIPWPVLDFHQGIVEVSTGVESVPPPVPDKKRKAGTAEDNRKSPTADGGSSSSSRQSTPPSSLERPQIKMPDSPTLESSIVPTTVDSVTNASTSSNQRAASGLVRKSSILKLRAFFEKSNLEPRGGSGVGGIGLGGLSSVIGSAGDKKTRKSSSFRIKEASSRFYRSLETGVEDTETASQLSCTAVETGATAATEVSAPVSHRRGGVLGGKKAKAAKPSLPVKRSKSMKVYRGFDVRDLEAEPPHPGQIDASVPDSNVIPATNLVTATPTVVLDLPTAVVSATPAPCDIVLSKTPSITYISSNEQLRTSQSRGATEVFEGASSRSTPLAGTSSSESNEKKKSPALVAVEAISSGADYDNIEYYATPLTTSSLDRGKEARAPSKVSASALACGSLDRGVGTSQGAAHTKIVPTYVNVLIRNQEAAHSSSKLDDDTRQLLHDCQTYLMHSDANEQTDQQRSKCKSDLGKLNPLEKKTRNRTLHERRHSFKQAVIAQNDATKIKRNEGSPCSNRSATSSSSESVGRVTDEATLAPSTSTTSESVSSGLPSSKRPGKKVHEYEAIWLSGVDNSSPGVTPTLVTTEGNNANHAGQGPVVAKDSLFIQKSDEIRLLLNELRSGRSSASVGVAVDSKPVSPVEAPLSPRLLHPERVLSELQELVERANRTHEESIRSPAVSPIPSTPVVSTLSVTASPKLSRKPPYVNYPQPPPRMDGKTCPTSPVLPRYLIAATAAVSNTPASALITPVNKSTATFNTSKTPPPLVHAPAFRPPPPYPTNLYVKLPPLNSVESPLDNITPTSPKLHRRIPPEYKDPPPVKRTVTQTTVQPSPPIQQPVAPPRSKRHSNAAAAAFPLGPPVPGRSFPMAPAAVPGIDVDAVAAVMAAAENSSPKSRSSAGSNGSGGGSASPTTVANRALTKALGKFQATAASFKTRLALLGDTKESGGVPSASAAPNSAAPTTSDPPSLAPMPPKLERESSFIKPTVVYVGDGITVVNTCETTTYVRKKQQYL